MDVELSDLSAFMAVARAGGFREAARSAKASPSGLSEAVRRLEAKLGVRLLNRTTRSVAPTEAGTRLLERLQPALGEVELALDVVNAFRERPAGTLRLNVPANVARTVLPSIIAPFLKAYPDIRMEVAVEDRFVDILAAGYDAGIRYDERLEQDMIAVPIGPRTQRIVTAASPAYLAAMAGPRIRATCSIISASPADLPAARRPCGNSSAMTRSCGSPRRRVSSSATARHSIWRSRRRSTGSASSICSRTGCGRISSAARSSRCWSPGGRASPARSFIIPAAATCRHRSAPSSISSAITADELRHAEPAHASVSYTTCACGTSWLTTS
jgi:DNA-binding transcriptional LysR family regulator